MKGGGSGVELNGMKGIYTGANPKCTGIYWEIRTSKV